MKKRWGTGADPDGLQCKTINNTGHPKHFVLYIYVTGLVYTIASRMMRRSAMEKGRRKWRVLQQALISKVQ